MNKRVKERNGIGFISPPFHDDPTKQRDAFLKKRVKKDVLFGGLAERLSQSFRFDVLKTNPKRPRKWCWESNVE